MKECFNNVRKSANLFWHQSPEYKNIVTIGVRVTIYFGTDHNNEGILQK